MKILNFIKNWSDNYYAEKEKVWGKLRIYWIVMLLLLMGLYLLQIYAFQRVLNDAIGWQSPPESFWDYFPPENWKAIGFQSVVVFGLIIRVFSQQFRNKWGLRFSELGEFIAFASFIGHYLWSQKISIISCSSPLIGVLQIPGNLISMFFMGWAFYKILWIIAITWETVRK